MSAKSLTEAVQRVSCRDASLVFIDLDGNQLADEELAELADCLLAHPDVVTYLYLSRNRLTDETGVKLARYLAASSTIEWLDLSNNQLSSATYLAVAAALRVNTSLQHFYIDENQAVDQIRIDAAYVEALQLNPDRPEESDWWLHSYSQDDFRRLKDAAEQLGHPSLQLLLAADVRSPGIRSARPR